MNSSLQTQRLLLIPLAFPKLQVCLTDLPALEAELCLSISQDVLTEHVIGAICKKIEQMTSMDETWHFWQTYWMIVISKDNFGAGLAGFKGVSNENGSTEIGYGIDPAYQNKGYMSEAVKPLVDWALQQLSCNTVMATMWKTLAHAACWKNWARIWFSKVKPLHPGNLPDERHHHPPRHTCR